MASSSSTLKNDSSLSTSTLRAGSGYLHGIEPLNENSFSTWLEQVKLTLRFMNLDYSLRHDALPPLDTDFMVEQKKIHDQWERSNRMSLIVIKNSISPTIRGSIPNSENAKVYLDLVEEQFKGTSKTNVGILILRMLTTKYSGTGGVREHIMMMNDMKPNVAHLTTSNLNKKNGSFKNKGQQGDKSKSNKFSTLGASTSTFKGTPKCRFCHKKGHIQRDCPKFKDWLAKKGIALNLMIYESFNVNVPCNTWWFDFGSTVHISNSLQGFRTIKKLARNQQTVKVGNGSEAEVEAAGTLSLVLEGGFILNLSETLYVPTITRNLISCPKLDRDGYVVTFGNGKMTKTNKKGSTRSMGLLELIHMDICGPFPAGIGGQKSFITFIDDYSHYMYLYLIHEKSEALETFKNFKAEVENQLDRKIKVVRSDRGGKYYGRHTDVGQSPGSFYKFCKIHGRKPNLNYLKVWGCPAEAKMYNPQSKKLDMKTVSCFFIGYPERSKGYRFYFPSHTTRIVETRHAEFLEMTDLSGSVDGRRIDFQEGTEESPITYVPIPINQPFESSLDSPIPYNLTNTEEPSTTNPVTSQELNEQQPQELPPPLRRSSRPRRPITYDDFMTYLHETDFDLGKVDNPTTFKDAMNCDQSTHVPASTTPNSESPVEKPAVGKPVMFKPTSGIDLSRVPYPVRLTNQKHTKEYGHFLDMFKQLKINLPFIEALQHIPKYVKYLKELLKSKDRLGEVANTPVSAGCSAVILNKLPEKLADPGMFTIPCLFGDDVKRHALADSGASINLMPYSLYAKLALGDLSPTRMTLSLADRLVKCSRGILKNVLVKVDRFVFPVDFVVIDMEADTTVPIILGRPFLRTAKAIIDVYEGKLTFRVGDESVCLKIANSVSAAGELVHQVDGVILPQVRLTQGLRDWFVISTRVRLGQLPRIRGVVEAMLPIGFVVLESVRVRGSSPMACFNGGVRTTKKTMKNPNFREFQSFIPQDWLVNPFYKLCYSMNEVIGEGPWEVGDSDHEVIVGEEISLDPLI
ncbi:hypothetical protein E3N88_38144 [Mikania micrantha]|uniref:CCHC-type domain-containing protein n=1 Tax=Mikania micrantha TaxID=192012 RepID=A0A5N6LT63_9ASTR|nr:hypothetical protein E3N88_38144 [Mikania micrantha]